MRGLALLALLAAVVGAPVLRPSSQAGSPPDVRISIMGIGGLQVRLMPGNAPRTCEAILRLAAADIRGKWHRAEAVPDSGDGPPYALVQATLEDGGELAKLAQERLQGEEVVRGAVVLVSGSSDIFVALGPHLDWTTMTVFGQVFSGLDAAEKILKRTVHAAKHASGVEMSLLDKPIGLSMHLLAAADTAGPPPASAPPVLVEFSLENLNSGKNGTAVIAVHSEWAPLGAARFLELVDRGFYDGHRFFRAVPAFVAQWGLHPDPQEIQRANQFAPAIQDDPLVKGVGNSRGRVTFAAAGPNTRTVQAFINLVDNKHLNSPKYSFAPFGEVVSGMDSVDQIYTGYGETADQGGLNSFGDAFARHQYPLMSRIANSRRVTSSEPSAAPAPPSSTSGMLLPFESLVALHEGQTIDDLGGSVEMAAAAGVAAVLALLTGLGAAAGLRRRWHGLSDVKSM